MSSVGKKSMDKKMREQIKRQNRTENTTEIIPFFYMTFEIYKYNHSEQVRFKTVLKKKEPS